MKIVLFGATGMVGQGALRECLRDPDVERVLAIGRSPTGRRDAKLREVVRADPSDLSGLEGELAACDACFFCLGVSSAGMSERDYRRVTKELTLAVARTLVACNPRMTFVYVSGAGTDSTERGRSMWARVKGETENALLRLPFASAYMFRPGFIQALHGITSRTRLYRALYPLLSPLFPVMNALFPDLVTTTERLGRAMLAVAKGGAKSPVLETRDINALARGAASPSTR
ncbi:MULTISPECIES: NAD-dependent epimerase/dehydratase family protein [Anaeromyxobacter]|uniref:NAD-dependent epimerase/dehydratase family protein n=1 Tax=Anaeromyxobacter TaxID=161492 RepID=UPI001F574E88|nr:MULTISPECIES: NAD-dependent epimerase/dehydratase family protein [unclassified Anaeromyxobacter]